jgi:hypothetical protein
MGQIKYSDVRRGVLCYLLDKMLPDAIVLILRLDITPGFRWKCSQILIISVKNIIGAHLLILAHKSYRREIWRPKELQFRHFLGLL